MKNNEKYISFETIQSALKQNTSAVDEIFRFYSGYFTTLSWDKDHVNEDMRYYIEIKVLDAIYKFNVEKAATNEKSKKE